MYTFNAYIDESGDQGFVINDEPNKSSSRWFIITAVLIKQSDEQRLKQLIIELRQCLNLQAKQEIHFRNLNHFQKIIAVSKISSMPIQIINVIVDKHSLKNKETFQNKRFRLYFYLMRLILERISWFCRDCDNPGKCRLVFEGCKGLSYYELEDYINKLKCDNEVKIDWKFIVSTNFLVGSGKEIKDLQIADCCASSINLALELRHGFTEHRYIKMLRERIYNKNENFKSYGLKFLFEPTNIHWVQKYYTKKIANP